MPTYNAGIGKGISLDDALNKGFRPIGDILKTPKFYKGDKVYYIGDSSSYQYDKPYEVIDCKPKSEMVFGLEIKLSPNQISYCSPDDFISESDYKKLVSEDSQDISSSKNDFRDGDRVYYNGPRHDLIEQGRLYVLFKYQQNIVGGKKFFEICTLDRVKNEERWITLEKSFVDNNFITEKEFKGRMSPFSNILSKDKFKEGSVAYYDGPGDEGYEYDVPYRIQRNRNDYSVWDIWVKTKHDKFGRFKFPTKKFVEENFLTADEYEITGKIKNNPVRNLLTNYKQFSRFKDGDTVFFIGDEEKKTIGFKIPDMVGGLKRDIKLVHDKPYVIEYYNRSAGMIRVKGADYSYPEKDFATASEYERFKSLEENTPDFKDEIGTQKNDIILKLQIYKDTQKDKLIWTRPYTTHDDWYRALIYLNNPPNSHLRLDLKRPPVLGEKEDKWLLEIYYHRNRNPISQLGGETPIHVMEIKESPVLLKLAKMVENKVDEEELKNPPEEDRSTWE